jgi:hypothetical protein
LDSEVNHLIGVDEDDGLMGESESRVGDSGPARRNDARGNLLKTGTIAAGSKLEDLSPKEYQEVTDFIQRYGALEYALFDKLMEEATHDADGNLFVEVDDETFVTMEDFEKMGDKTGDDGTGRPKVSRGQQRGNNIDHDFDFVMDTMGIKGSEKRIEYYQTSNGCQ